MFINSPRRQSSCNRLLLQRIVIALIAIAGSALIMLVHFNDEQVTTWSQPGLVAEPNIIWPTVETGGTAGMTRYEISADPNVETTELIRFVF